MGKKSLLAHEIQHIQDGVNGHNDLESEERAMWRQLWKVPKEGAVTVIACAYPRSEIEPFREMAAKE